jgi:hypothetical protein
VGTAGGTEVTITGSGITSGARVRVGPSAMATVLRSSSTSLTFRAPARVAGSYDVSLFSASGLESSVLTGGLTYVAEADAPAPGTPTPGTPAPSTPMPTIPPPPSTPAPDDGTGTGPADGAGAGTPTKAGPRGERLVRTAKYASLRAGFWAMNCSPGCAGAVV